MNKENRFLEENREEANFINNLYGLGDEDHKTALDVGHVYDLMRKFADHKVKLNTHIVIKLLWIDTKTVLRNL